MDVRGSGRPAERGVLMTVETETKYAGYIDQQRRQMERIMGSDLRAIPAAWSSHRIPGHFARGRRAVDTRTAGDFGPGGPDSGRYAGCSCDPGCLPQCFT